MSRWIEDYDNGNIDIDDYPCEGEDGCDDDEDLEEAIRDEDIHRSYRPER